MKLLDRYLLGQFVKYFFTVNVGFAAIYVLIDFIEKFDNFQEAGKSIGLALKYFLLNIPFVVDQLGPVLILLSGIITLGILNHTNELTALKAGGVPLKQIIRPLLLGAALFTTLMLAAAQWLLPYTITTTNTIWDQQVNGKLPLGIYRNGRYYYRGTQGFYSFQWPNPKHYVFKNFSYSSWDDHFDLHTLITAGTAAWNSEANNWVMNDVQIQKVQGNGRYAIHNLHHWETRLPEKPVDFLVSTDKMAEMSLTDLYRETTTASSPSEVRQAWETLYSRLSYILLGIPLLLLGMPVLLIFYQRWGKDLAVAIPASCGMAFVAWGIWGALQSLATAGYLSPLLAAVTIHIVFSITGLMMLRRQDM